MSENRLRKNFEHLEHRLKEIMNLLPEPTFVIDIKGTVIIWNAAIEKYSGIGASQIVGQGNYEYSFLLTGERVPGLLDLVFASDSELEHHHYTDVQRSPKGIRATLQLSGPNGRPADS